MPSEIRRSPCPMCAEPNPLTVAYCRRCEYRLPWADALEGVPEAEAKNPSRLESAMDNQLRDWRLLKAKTVACRFCNEPIEIDTKQCSHCGEWLVAFTSLARIDKWSSGYEEKDSKRVKFIENDGRAGCFSVLSILVGLGMVWFWR